ncbi:MAG: hypothetical protein JXR91_01075 [Deltaproteobacteria bacterium]|nr:hypothetical protein [Deltaproteobacteria bacterium]
MRAKIIFPNLLIVLILGIGSYFYLDTVLSQKADNKLSKELKVVSSLFERSEALRGYEQLNQVSRLSMTNVVASLFKEMDIELAEGESQEAFEKRLRLEWFNKAVQSVETASSILSQKGHKPAIVFITDRNGVVLARNTTPNACPAGRNVATAMPVVQRALDGEANYALWSVDGSSFDKKYKGTQKHLCSLINTGLLEISAAPIWGPDDKISGVLAVGYEVSNGTAAKKASFLGHDLAVINGGKVYSTSFTTDTDRQTLNSEISRPDILKEIKSSFNTKKTTGVFKLNVNGKQYLALFSPLANADKKDEIGYLFIGSEAESRFFSVPLKILLIIILSGLLLVIVAGIILGNYFMKPVMAIEEGLLKIINGEYDYRFDVKSSEVGGLSYRINQLVNVFTDQEESEDVE